jgi:hypothetical protein
MRYAMIMEAKPAAAMTMEAMPAEAMPTEVVAYGTPSPHSFRRRPTTCDGTGRHPDQFGSQIEATCASPVDQFTWSPN